MSLRSALRGGSGVICPLGLVACHVAPRVAGLWPQLVSGVRDVTSHCFAKCKQRPEHPAAKLQGSC